jgi:peptidoglycan-associated lipoprotein
MATIANGQSVCLLNKGKDAFAKEQYQLAIEYFTKQISKSKTSEEIQAETNYYLGRSFMRISKPKEAIRYFKQALTYNHIQPEVHLYYGKALQMLEMFSEAMLQFKKYEELMPTDTIGQQATESLETCIFMMENPGPYTIKPVPSLNSAEMDYCPFFKGNTFDAVYFTSSRQLEDNPKVSPESGEFFSNIYISEIDKKGFWQTPKIVDGNINTSFDEGAASLNRTTRNLYFTRCTYTKRKDKACRIYIAKKSGHLWLKVEELYIPDIPNDISIGHPSISNDELTLYFVADSMLGGYGGKDLYKVSRKKRNENFGPPQNLGPNINTRYDEAYPFIRFDNTLYFASRGHNSIGGYDIFIATQTGQASYDIEHMDYPINSSHEDFGIVFMDRNNEGFITSERIGGIGKADIYYFYIPIISLSVQGIIWDKMTNAPISEVQISLMDNNNELIDMMKTDETGRYKFTLAPDFDYTIYIKHPDYGVSKENLSTQNIKENKNFNREIVLEKK